jgi:hypothetical protein
MRKKTRIVSSEEDDLTLSKSPPTKKKFKMDEHEFYDGLSEEYYSSPKRSSRLFELEKRRSSRLGPSRPKYALRSKSEKEDSTDDVQLTHDNIKSQQESDDSIHDINNDASYSRSKRVDTQSLRLNRFRSRREERYEQESQKDKHSSQDEEEFSQKGEESNSDSEDEVWEEEEEEEEDDFLDLGDNVRMTRSRKAFYPKGKNADERSLRKKTPVNYASQMYPQAFQVVDALVELDKTNNLPLGFNQKNSLNGNRSWGFNMPRTPSKLFRLNEVCKSWIDWVGRRRTANRASKGEILCAFERWIFIKAKRCATIEYGGIA